MIIRITFKDNDFTHIIENFFIKGLHYRVLDYKIQHEYLNPKEYKELAIESEEFMKKITYKVAENNIEKNDLTKVKVFFKKMFLYYLFKNHEEDYKYLSENLKINFQKTFTPKWENGEVGYYIIVCDKLLTM